MNTISYDFTKPFEVIYEYLDSMTEIAEANFLGISGRDEIEYGRSCLNTLDELQKLRDITGKIQERMEEVRDELCLEGGGSTRTSTKEGLREIKVEVSQGMLDQHLLSMTGAKKSGIVRLEEDFVITVPGGEQFVTQLVSPGNKLRERGRIRAFYEANKVKAGDQIELKETETGKWLMTVKREEDLRKELLKFAK